MNWNRLARTYRTEQKFEYTKSSPIQSYSNRLPDIFLLDLFLFSYFRIVTRGFYSEKDAAKCIREILEAVAVSMDASNE